MLKYALIFVNINTDNNEFKDLFLTDDEWLFIIEAIRILQVFYKPSIRLQGEVYITLSNALLDIHNVSNKLTALKHEYAFKTVCFLIFYYFIVLSFYFIYI